MGSEMERARCYVCDQEFLVCSTHVCDGARVMVALRAERDRYARALRRVVRKLLVERSSISWRAGRKPESNKLFQKVGDLYAREARGPWRETWGGKT